MKVELIKELIATRGIHYQCDVAKEECSELIKEVCKMTRGKGNIQNLAEEMADVAICIEQLQIMFGITDEMLYGWKRRKEKRTEERLIEYKEFNEMCRRLDESAKFVNGDDWSD